MEPRPLHQAGAGKRGLPHALPEVGPPQRPATLIAEHQLIQLSRQSSEMLGQRLDHKVR
jgi:hypothetical protein